MNRGKHEVVKEAHAPLPSEEAAGSTAQAEEGRHGKAARGGRPARERADSFERALYYLDRKVSRAVREFGLFGDGDRILLALSGGKDSLALLHALVRRRRTRPERLDLMACHIRGGFCGGACSLADLLAGVCEELAVPFTVVDQDLGPVEAATRKDTGKRLSPCFVCSWHRRKALFGVAQEHGFNLVAFGHHKDDIAETLLLNLLWQGRHESMLPRQPLFGGKVTIVRPLALVDEAELRRVARLGRLPAHVCPCPYGETSKRETAAEMIRLARAAGCRSVTNNLLRSSLVGWDPGRGHDNGRPEQEDDAQTVRPAGFPAEEVGRSARRPATGGGTGDE